MKIRLLSDLHHEFFRTKSMYTESFMEYKGEDVLVLAGDIAVGANNVTTVIDEFLDAGFPKIVYLPGNHEFYGSTIKEFNEQLDLNLSDQKYWDKVYAFTNPNDNMVIIDGVLFCGGTLWTNFREDRIAHMACQSRISDFKVIKDFSTNKAAMRYYNDLEGIEFAYNEFPEYKKVIVTHFLPAVECIHPRWRGPDLLNSYFANDLGEYIQGLSNTTWLFGHTHDPIDIMIGDTRMIANPHGYYGYETRDQFNPHLQITV
jgi:predicted phosphodiesterase